MSSADSFPAFRPHPLLRGGDMQTLAAVYLPAEQAAQAVELAEQLGLQAWVGGTIEKHGSRKAVVVEPLGLTYEGETLQIR